MVIVLTLPLPLGNLFSDTDMVNSYPSLKAPGKYYLFRAVPHFPRSFILSALPMFSTSLCPSKEHICLQSCLPCWVVSSSRSGLVLLPIFQLPWGQETLFIAPGGSDSKDSVCNAGDLALIPGLGRSPGERNSCSLQYSGLENSMDRRAWRATIHGVTNSQTRLRD